MARVRLGIVIGLSLGVSVANSLRSVQSLVMHATSCKGNEMCIVAHHDNICVWRFLSYG